jgi:hypothetical protein
MIQAMADENMQEMGFTAVKEQETVRAIVLAYAKGDFNGEIEGVGFSYMPMVPDKTNKSQIRYAPKFRRGCAECDSEHPYTDRTISDLLGWSYPNGESSHRVRNALLHLEQEEQGTFDDLDTKEQEALEELTSDQDKVLIEEANLRVRS